MFDQETYHSMTAGELWQKYQDYKAGKVEEKKPETVGQWKQSAA